MVLVCALLLMAATMVIGVAVARGAFALMASARTEGDRLAARAMAQAALRDAERDIAGEGAAAGARAVWFDPAAGADFPAGCGSAGVERGLCRASAPPAWQSVDLAAVASSVLVPYGRFTGATLTVGTGTLPARLPAYLIEKLEPGGADAGQGSFYRITAIGFGMRASTYVVLQALYRKPAPVPPEEPADADGDAASDEDTAAEDAGNGPGGTAAGDTAQDPSGGGSDGGAATGSGADPPSDPLPESPPRVLPAGRIGWREIANWPELHARAHP